MIKYLFFIFSFLIACVGHAQHLPIYSQYVLNPLVLNPAQAGTAQGLRMVAHYRKQWIGFDPDEDITPSTLTIAFDTPFKNKTSAMGTVLTVDKFAVTTITDQLFIFSQKVNLTHKVNLTLGLQVGYSYIRNDYAKLNKSEDPAFGNNFSTLFSPKLGAGVLLNISNFYVSISLPQNFLTKQKDTLGNRNAIYSKLIYTQLGIKFKLNDEFQLRPNVLWRYINYSNVGSIDLNLMADWRKVFSVGLSYRYQNSLVALAEFNVNQLTIGYAYDYNISQLSKVSSGSHEILLKYVFRYGINAVNSKTFK